MTTNSVTGKNLRINTIITRSFAVVIAALVIIATINFPLYRFWIGLSLAVYGILLIKFPMVWTITLPFLLPFLDLSPLTGRIYLDEFDLFILTTIAILLWRGSFSNVTSFIKNLGKPGIIIAFLLISYLASTYIGLYPFQHIDLNSFSNYYSPYNSLRVAKGFFWAILFLPLIAQLKPGDLRNLLIPGMIAGLSGLCLIVLTERSLFSGLQNFSSDYRITGTFFSMNTGGGHIEAYLAITIPFIGAWALTHKNNLTVLASSLILFVFSCYAMFTTFARGGYLALLVLLVIFVTGFIVNRSKGTSQKKMGRTVLGIFGVMLVVVIMSWASFSSTFMQSRMETIGEDFKIRLNHWRDALKIRDMNISTYLFGMGLGAFPQTYYHRVTNKSSPTTYELATENSTSFLKLGSGEPSYIGQRIQLKPGKTYHISVKFRGNNSKARLTVPICEWSLLRSYNCEWLVFPFNNATNEWKTATASFQWKTNGVNLLRPMQLALYNSAGGTVLEINHISLIDGLGNELLKNGDFSLGMDHWFFSTERHLPWHIKQLWVAILFEQGWFGVVSIAALILITLFKLIGQVRKESFPIAISLLASIAGFLTVGLFGSLFDAPRLTFLFYLVVFLSLLSQAPKNESKNIKRAQQGLSKTFPV